MFLFRFFLMSCLFFLVSSAQAKLQFDPQFPIYDSDGIKYGFDQIHAALDKAFSFQKPVVIHIHGRGDEPLKSLEGKTLAGGATVSKMEKDYNVRVLLFNWESQGMFLDREKPLSHIPAAVESFKKVLNEIKSYDLKNKILILHAHSMGSIVLQNYILKNGWMTSGSSLFTQVLFTEPDADNLQHYFWMDQIASKEKVFITVNNDDVILDQSTDARPRGVQALGLNPTSNLSLKSTYLDFTKLGEKINKVTRVHEVFDKDNMKYQVSLCTALTQIFTGQRPQLDVYQPNPALQNYFKFNFGINKSHPCFK